MANPDDVSRFDLERHFAAASPVELKEVSDCFFKRFGERFGLPPIELDGEFRGEDEWGWWQASSDSFAINITWIYRRVDEELWGEIPKGTNYVIHLFWDSTQVTWQEIRRIQESLSEFLERPLIPYPTRYFA